MEQVHNKDSDAEVTVLILVSFLGQPYQTTENVIPCIPFQEY